MNRIEYQNVFFFTKEFLVKTQKNPLSYTSEIMDKKC